jgi:hypothetical protein
MASADPAIAREAARTAANTAVARLDSEGRKQRMAAAHEARLQMYMDAVDPGREWSEEDRIAAAKSEMAADMARLSILGVQARKKKRELAKAS